MMRLLSVLLLLGVIGLAANPVPADAQGTLEHETVKCLNEAVKECAAEFPGGGWITAGLRGWCYTIRAAICLASGGDSQRESPTAPELT